MCTSDVGNCIDEEVDEGIVCDEAIHNGVEVDLNHLIIGVLVFMEIIELEADDVNEMVRIGGGQYFMSIDEVE
jgi:hypothetical protein